MLEALPVCERPVMAMKHRVRKLVLSKSVGKEKDSRSVLKNPFIGTKFENIVRKK